VGRTRLNYDERVVRVAAPPAGCGRLGDPIGSAAVKFTIDFSEVKQPILGAITPDLPAGLTLRRTCEHLWSPAEEPKAEPRTCGRPVWVNPGWLEWPRQREVICPDCAD
jgi:hypothetical protein